MLSDTRNNLSFVPLALTDTAISYISLFEPVMILS